MNDTSPPGPAEPQHAPLDDPLSDEDLEMVVGGLARPLVPPAEVASDE